MLQLGSACVLRFEEMRLQQSNTPSRCQRARMQVQLSAHRNHLVQLLLQLVASNSWDSNHHGIRSYHGQSIALVGDICLRWTRCIHRGGWWPARLRRCCGNLRLILQSTLLDSCRNLQIATLPIDTAKVRLQLLKKSGDAAPGSAGAAPRLGMVSVIRLIVQQEGTSALYKGFWPAIQRQLVFASLRVGLYTKVRM